MQNRTLEPGLKEELLAKQEQMNRRLETKSTLIKKLEAKKVKHDAEAIIAIEGKNDEVIFLERGNDKAGYKHVLNHAEDFKRKGIKVARLPHLLMATVKDGEQKGFQGKKRDGRPIFQVTFFKTNVDVALTVGKNGFIVGANPTTLTPAK